MFKGSDRLCKVVELSIHCCGKLLSKRKEFFLRLEIKVKLRLYSIGLVNTKYN